MYGRKLIMMIKCQIISINESLSMSLTKLFDYKVSVLILLLKPIAEILGLSINNMTGKEFFVLLSK